VIYSYNKTKEMH